MTFREMTVADLPAVFLVRAAAKENTMPLSALKQQGITVASCTRQLASTHKGFVCEDGGLVIGFTMGDRSSGEVWVLSVWPEHEGQGIGRRLLKLVQDWLFAGGWQTLWLTTGVEPSRALVLYQKLGWKIVGTVPEGHSYRMELQKSADGAA